MAKCVESIEDPIHIKNAIKNNITDLANGLLTLKLALESIDRGHPGVKCPVESCCEMARAIGYTTAQFAALETLIASKKKGSPHAN